MSALCTARLLSPFLRLIETRGEDPELVPSQLRGVTREDRVPVALVHSMLEGAVEHFGDPLLGLRLGASLCLGELGPLDYALRCAPTTRHALEAAGRYSALQADGYRIRFENWRGGGLIRLIDETSWPRSIADMSMSGAYRLHVALRAPFLSRLECWFPYATPRNIAEYEAFFPGAILRFDAPFHAFAFDETYEDAPQPAADSTLYALLCKRLDAAMDEVARASRLRPRVRLAIERQMVQAREVSAVEVARSLRMSRRTLSRRLEQEGTSFADELDGVRHELALSYVGSTERPLSEIAFLLGFSHVESFHRAFKRWTRTTPLAHRTAARDHG